MMLLVWLIDLGTVTLDILSGRRKVHPTVQFGLWGATLGAVVAGVAAVWIVLAPVLK
ncbi:hypothetical protein [Nocardia stercoris]|uniref:hypothetical protein n=1 Tax=Nocardia stercoris TaxID=2483361 RepID=UPI0018F48332|nr:hypothetical protein [Nocardia stercoris]